MNIRIGKTDVASLGCEGCKKSLCVILQIIVVLTKLKQKGY